MGVQFHVQAQMPHATTFLDWLQHHLQTEGVQVLPHATRLTLHMPEVGTLAFAQRSAHGFACAVEAVDARMAQLIQLSLEEHAQEFLTAQGTPPSALQWQWSGLPRSDAAHRFQVVQISAVQALTPHMRRVRLAVPEMAPFAGDGLHVRLLLPPPATHVEWPSLDTHGRLQWANGQTPLPQRIYTIRNSNAEAGWLDIDIVRHDHHAPGAQWIAQVQPGDRVGLLGPAGGALPQASHLLLVADMAALPAALRIAQQQTQCGGSWQLLAMSAHRDDLAYCPPAPQVQWHVGDVSSQPAAVLQWLHAQAAAHPQTQLWLAAGQALVQATKAALQDESIKGLATHKMAAYWK